MKDVSHCLIFLFRKCTSFYLLSCRQGMIYRAHKQLWSCLTNWKGVPGDFGKKLKLKWGNININVRGWHDSHSTERQSDVNILMNIHHPAAESLSMETVKPAIVQDYTKHMGYENKNDYMTNSYSIRWHTRKWVKNFSPLPGLSNSEQFHSPHHLWLHIIPQEFQNCLQ